jgi:hypothetical protein
MSKYKLECFYLDACSEITVKKIPFCNEAKGYFFMSKLFYPPKFQRTFNPNLPVWK